LINFFHRRPHAILLLETVPNQNPLTMKEQGRLVVGL
jgi:hypothetical protein